MCGQSSSGDCQAAETGWVSVQWRHCPGDLEEGGSAGLLQGIPHHSGPGDTLQSDTVPALGVAQDTNFWIQRKRSFTMVRQHFKYKTLILIYYKHFVELWILNCICKNKHQQSMIDMIV